MTYNEAMVELGKLPQKILKGDIEMDVLIVPKLEIDFKNFFKDFHPSNFSNITCLEYSTNQEYSIFGVFFNGGDIVFEDLMK